MVIPCSLPSPDTPPYTRDTPNNNIIFIAGLGSDTWSIPSKRDLLHRCTHLEDIARGNTPSVRIHEEKRGFELFLRLLDPSSTLPSPPPSVTTCRSALEAACKFHCPAVVGRCVELLDLQMSVENVLEVIRDLVRWCPGCLEDVPSAPEPAGCDVQVTQWCTSLLHNCLIIIEQNPEIFLQEGFDSLSIQDLSIILSRESLQLKSEYLLYESLLRWYRRQCMQHNKPQSPNTRREILGNLIFKVRFGLMTREEFLSGPARSNIFSTNEVNEILNIIDNKVLITEGIYKNINTKRKMETLEANYLSDRTKSHLKKVKLKKEKTNNTLLNCLTVWTVLFD